MADETEKETPEAEAATEKAESRKQKAEAEEPKPKPKRTRKPAAKKAEGAKAEEAKAEKAKAEEAKAEKAKAEKAKAEEAKAEDAKAEEPKAEEKPASRGRRGGAAAAGRSQSRRSARRQPDADVTVRARAKYVRCAPRKARLVIDHIRGKDVAQARAILTHTPRAASRDVLKLLESAIANAENNHELVADELRVGKAYVDEGPTLKRYRPRALGRATRIRKRTSHLTIELVSKE